jgi:quercetin dioxygenase-like cupin family protein
MTIDPEDGTGAIALTTFVRAQPGGIVSRTLLKKAAGSVTVFAFDVGQGLSEHTTPYDALALVVDGEATISVSGRGHRVRAGEVVPLPAGQPHAVGAVTPVTMLLIMIRGEDPKEDAGR